MQSIFADRDEAGQKLAKQLLQTRAQWEAPDREWIILALPRGGVPVAYQVAKKLNLPLDVMIVRKVGLPGNPELAMGAIASGDVEIMNPFVIREWQISHEEFAQVAQRELIELERREQLYRRGRLPLDIRGKYVFLVDDGIATGSTMRAAVAALKKLHAQSIVIAVPTASSDTIAELETEVDDIICLYTPEFFPAVGGAYRNFSQTTDDDVSDLLERTEHQHTTMD